MNKIITKLNELSFRVEKLEKIHNIKPDNVKSNIINEKNDIITIT